MPFASMLSPLPYLNRAADLKGTVAQSILFAEAWGVSFNKHERAHLHHRGKWWFLHFVYINALHTPLLIASFLLLGTDFFIPESHFRIGSVDPIVGDVIKKVVVDADIDKRKLFVIAWNPE